MKKKNKDKKKKLTGYKIVGILLILAGAFIGNYVQQNKDEVKTKLKKFIDKM